MAQLLDDVLIGLGTKAKAQLLPHPGGLRYAFLCDTDLQYWLTPLPAGCHAESLAKRAGHMFPFDFTPLLKVDLKANPGYVLWLEGCGPARLQWRTSTGQATGASFDVLPSTPSLAVEALAKLISQPE